MDSKMIANKLKAYAEYLRRTRVSVGETEAIERISACAFGLDELAKEMTKDETDLKQG